MNTTMTSVCPICESILDMKQDTVVGELITCDDCGAELEVVSVDPIKIEEAPEVEEDWGE